MEQKSSNIVKNMLANITDRGDNPSAIGQQPTRTSNFEKDDTPVSKRQLLSIFDMSKKKCDVSSMSGINMQQVSAYDLLVEPAVIFNAIFIHSFLKYNIVPSTAVIDENGVIAFNNASYSSLTIAFANLPNPNLIGIFQVLRQNNTFVGNSTMNLSKTQAGLALDFVLSQRVGAIFTWNVVKDGRESISATRANDGGLVDSFDNTETDLSDFLSANPEDSHSWTITGNNVVVETYPLVGRPQMFNLLIDAIFANALPKFGQLLVDDYMSSISPQP